MTAALAQLAQFLTPEAHEVVKGTLDEIPYEQYQSNVVTVGTLCDWPVDLDAVKRFAHKLNYLTAAGLIKHGCLTPPHAIQLYGGRTALIVCYPWSDHTQIEVDDVAGTLP